MRSTRLLFSLLATILLAPALLAQGLGDLPGLPGSKGAQQGVLPGEEVVISAKASVQRAAPGDQFAIAVILDHAPEWHTWPNQPVLPPELEGVQAIPTVARIDPQPGALSHVGPAQYPEPGLVQVGFGSSPVQIRSFKGRAVIYLPVIIAQDAPAGVLDVPIQLSYQACDDSICLQPTTERLSVSIEIGAFTEETSAASDADAALFADFDPSIYARLRAGETFEGEAGAGGAEFDFFGARFELANDAYWLILPIGFIAGLLLNFTPCVLPVIPLKVLSLQKQADQPAKLLLYGTVYCIGIVATFLALGLLILGVRTGAETQEWGQIFSSPIFAIAMAILVGAMGLGMMGLFTIRLPRAVYMLNPSHDSVTGNLGMGVLTAILSTPCTGPFLGAVIAWSVTQPRWLGFGAFAVMGLGMAFPYALLIAFPKLIDRLPRSGPGGELIKQVMGLILLSVAAFLASNVTSAKWPWWIVAGLSAGAFAWTLFGGLRIAKKPAGRAIAVVVGSVGIALSLYLGYVMTRPAPIPWTPYSDAALAQAKDSGKIVVVKFTAKWCANCHVIEGTVLNVEPAKSMLNRSDVIPIKVDLTSESNEEGWSAFREISGGGGIPLTAVYRPGEEDPTLFRSFYTADRLREAMGITGGGAVPTARATP